MSIYNNETAYRKITETPITEHARYPDNAFWFTYFPYMHKKHSMSDYTEILHIGNQSYLLMQTKLIRCTFAKSILTLEGTVVSSIIEITDYYSDSKPCQYDPAARRDLLWNYILKLKSGFGNGKLIMAYNLQSNFTSTELVGITMPFESLWHVKLCTFICNFSLQCTYWNFKET